MYAFGSVAHMALSLSNGIMRDHKGGTLHTLASGKRESGYIVGGHNGVKPLGLHRVSVDRIRRGEQRSTATGAILHWTRYRWEDIATADCVGWWQDGNGMVHIDVNTIVDDLDKALALGDKRGEKGIYNIANGRCIPVK